MEILNLVQDNHIRKYYCQEHVNYSFLRVRSPLSVTATMFSGLHVELL